MNKKNQKSQNYKNKWAIGLVILLVVAVVAVAAFFYAFKSEDKVSTFTDGFGEEQTISSFQDCMDWAMPWEEKDGVQYCYAPGDVTFTDTDDLN